jgi:hypothetical protein
MTLQFFQPEQPATEEPQLESCMSRLSYSIPSAPLSLARVLIGLPLLLGFGTGVAQAQGSSNPAGDHAGPPHHQHTQRSAALDGPPAPAVLQNSIQLSGKALEQYSQRYESHMAVTKVSRDSLRANMQAARAAFEKGDRTEAQSRRDSLEKQWKQLADQDKKFEAGLKDILTKDQQARYQQLQDRRKQEARDQWRHHHDGDRRPPADSTAQNR